MAVTITQEKETWDNTVVSVPYKVQQEESDGYLWGYLAEDLMAARLILDWGFLPETFNARRLSSHAVQFSVQYDRTAVIAYLRNINDPTDPPTPHSPGVTGRFESRVSLPRPQQLKVAVDWLQGKNSAGAPAFATTYLDPQRLKSVVVNPPEETDRLDLTFPTSALATTFRSTLRGAAHKLNADQWGPHPPGTAMILRAGAVGEIGGLARVTIGVAVKPARSVTRGGITLTNVLPFSHLAEVVESQSENEEGAQMQVAVLRALHELEVYERANFSPLGIPPVP